MNADPVFVVPEFAAAREACPADALRSEAVAAIALAVPSLSESLGERDRRMFGVHSGFFYLPLVLSRSWDLLSPDELRDLGASLSLGHMHYAIQDGLVDRGHGDARDVLISEACLTAYLAGLGRATGLDLIRVHQLHCRYFEPYAKAVIAEVNRRGDWRAFTAVEIRDRANKSAPIGTVLEALLARAGLGEEAPALLGALFDFCCGLQLIDDLADLSDDIVDGVVTPPLALLADAPGLSPATIQEIAGSDGGELELQGLSLASGVAQVIVRTGLRYFERAAERSATPRLSPMCAIAREWASRAGSRLKSLDEAEDALAAGSNIG